MRTGPAWKFWRSALPGLLLAAHVIAPAHAGQVAIATAPLFNSAISLVKPNLLFLLDDSSSMAYNYLPDEVPWDIRDLSNPNPLTDSHAVALTSSQCSGVAYDPTFKYDPPLKADGTSYPNAAFNGAYPNGFDTSQGTPRNLGVVVAGDPAHFYYYYNLGGTQKALDYSYSNGQVITTTTFYKECNSPASSPTAGSPARFTKKVVSSVSGIALAQGGPVGPDERQNYANWYSYYRTRLLMMKTIAGNAFKKVDATFRVGFTTFHDKGVDPSTGTYLPIDDFVSGTLASPKQKENFYTTVYGINAAVEQPMFTPSRGALSKAGRIFAGKFFPGNVFPATTTADKLKDPMQYSCQQNFVLLASDGYWNTSNDTLNGNATTNFGPFGLDNTTLVGNQDGGSTPRPLYDDHGASNTLADVAMYYYQTDLRHPGNCTSGSTGNDLCPVDSQGVYAPNVPKTPTDTTTTPHMNTFTVGLAINGMLGYSDTYENDPTGAFHDILNNNASWPDPQTGSVSSQVIERVDDMWHAAVDGHGHYFNAKNPSTLGRSLQAAIADIQSRLGFGAAGATSSLAPIAGNNALFVASYATVQWTGNLMAESIILSGPNAGQVNTTPAWCVEPSPALSCTSGKLEGQLAGNGWKQPPASGGLRTVWMKDPTSNNLVSFDFTNLSAAQKLNFNPNQVSQWASWTNLQKTTYLGDTLVNFLRGDSQFEINDDPSTSLYRTRLARLGDIVDSQPVYVAGPFYQYADPGYANFKSTKAGRKKTVFVAANDGMLHAFKADTTNGNFDSDSGEERWAFVPTVVMPNMFALADINYSGTHRNYVNGRLVWSDVCFANCTDAGTADWHTILMGGLGGGGRGYYALDVTNPAAPTFLWEFSATDDPDVGYSFGNPLAVKKADGSWVVTVASGYDNGANDSAGNSYAVALKGSGKGVLFVLDPKTGKPLTGGFGKYSTGVGTDTAPSGLAKMAYFADNPEQNATALFGYGGDLAGNLWRFDINKKATDNGAVIKLATFELPVGTPQPITTRVEMTTKGTDRMIFVGTGKYLEQNDLTDKSKQSVYAIIDKGASTVFDRNLLAGRILENQANQTRKVTDTNGNSPTAGWYVDFPDVKAGAERDNVDMVLAVGTLVVPTNVPTGSSDQVCNASGYSWINFLDFKTGEALGGNPQPSAAVKFANDLTTGINAIWLGSTPEIIRTGNATGPAKAQGVVFGGVSAGVKGHRVGWREIFMK